VPDIGTKDAVTLTKNEKKEKKEKFAGDTMIGMILVANGSFLTEAVL
jgi:hypothetical protein